MHVWKYELWSLQLHRICSMFNVRNKIFSLFNIYFHPNINVTQYSVSSVSIRWKMVTMLQFLIFAFYSLYKRTDFSSYFISIWNFHVLLLTLSIFHCVNYLDCIHNTSPSINMHTTLFAANAFNRNLSTLHLTEIFRDHLVKWFRYYHKLWSMNIDDNNNNDSKRPFSIYNMNYYGNNFFFLLFQKVYNIWLIEFVTLTRIDSARLFKFRV